MEFCFNERTVVRRGVTMNCEKITLLCIFIIQIWNSHSYQSDVVISLNPSGSILQKNQPPVIYAKDFEILFIACQVKSNGKPEISWLHNHKSILVPPPYSIPWSHGQILYVRPVMKNINDGLYECIVKKDKKVYSKGVKVIARKESLLPSGFPRIVHHPRHVHTRRNRVDFQCSVSGAPPVEITWYHGSTPINNNKAYEVLPITTGEDKLYVSNLAVKNVSSVKRKFYRCVAINKLGQVVSEQASIKFNQDKSRTRREDYAIPFRGNCDVEANGNGFPGKINLEDIRSTCVLFNGDKKQFLVQWLPPVEIKDYPNTTYLITFFSSEEMIHHCFTVKVPMAYFSEDDGMNPEYIYFVSVEPQPRPSVLETVMKNLGKCIPIHGTSTMLFPTEETPEDIVFKKASTNRKKNQLVLILVGVSAVLLIIFLVYIVRQVIYKKNPNEPLKVGINGNNIYISYAASSQKDEERILKLAAFLSSYDFNVCMDLLRQVEINEMGGLAQWVPEVLRNADKILLVLSPQYLQALDIQNRNDLRDEVCKIHSEFNYIKALLYQTCQITPQLVIMLDGLKKEAVPDILRSRTLCQFPNNFQHEDVSNFVGLLLGMEPIQIPAALQTTK